MVIGVLLRKILLVDHVPAITALIRIKFWLPLSDDDQGLPSNPGFPGARTTGRTATAASTQSMAPAIHRHIRHGRAFLRPGIPTPPHPENLRRGRPGSGSPARRSSGRKHLRKYDRFPGRN